MANGDQSNQQPPQYTTAQIQALLGASGMSPSQISQMPQSVLNFYQQYPNAVGSGIASTNQGQVGGVSLGQLGSILNAFGGGKAAAPPAPGAVNMDPANAATNLGAAALNMPAIYNPTPQQASAKSGVGQVAMPTSSAAVPTMAQAGQGPWTTTPGIFAKAPMPAAAQGGTPTPIPPANAVGPMQPTPYATAPAAPGPPQPPATGMIASPAIRPLSSPPAPLAQDPSMAAHTSALADAGKALYAHFGGDPSSASPADIANFHTQLTSTFGSAMQPNAATNYAAGANAPTFEKPPIRMQAGGPVPDTDEPPEARRKGLTVPTPGSRGQAPSTTSGGASSQGSPSSSAPPPSSDNAIQNLINMRNMRQAESQGQPIGGTGYDPVAGGYVGISPGTGQSGYIYPTQEAATAGGATGQGAIGMGPNMSQVSGAIGGLASGLAAAAQKYAESVKPWQMQKSAIPNPPSDVAQEPQLQAPPSPQGQPRQQANPYMAMIATANPAMANIAAFNPSAAYYSNYFPNMA